MRRAILLLPIGASFAVAAACTLNPQPLPPGLDAPTAADAGSPSDGGASLGSTDTGGGGRSADASAVDAAASPSGEGGIPGDDGGDAGTDAGEPDADAGDALDASPD
jgi:hypothetical protein